MLSWLHRDDGAVALIAAVAAIVIFASAALVVDLGVLYIAQVEMQASADAAALAGAQELPAAGTATTVARDYAPANSDPGISITITTPYEGDPNKIHVTCSKSVAYVLAPVFGVSSGNAIASAVGVRYTNWSGEALPFINLNDDYTASPSINIWEKIGPGYFESINNYEIHNPANPATIYFSIDYMNGVELKNGFVANIKQEIGYVFDRHHPSVPVYVLSLRKSVLDSGRVLLIGGATKDMDDLKNGDPVHPSQLVLLECTFDAYSDKDKRLDLTVLNVYDINAGELPPNYAGPAGASGSVLSR